MRRYQASVRTLFEESRISVRQRYRLLINLAIQHALGHQAEVDRLQLQLQRLIDVIRCHKARASLHDEQVNGYLADLERFAQCLMQVRRMNETTEIAMHPTPLFILLSMQGGRIAERQGRADPQ